jgi:hypothetical protein
MSNLSNFGKIYLLCSTCSVKFVSNLSKILFYIVITQNRIKIGYASLKTGLVL